VAGYGPDDKTVTKIVLAIFATPSDEEDSGLQRWVGTNIVSDLKAAREMYEFMRAHGVRTVTTATVVMGCPHEEGEDFPDGGDFPFCPFWKGKQGSGTADDRWKGLKRLRSERLGFTYKFWLPK
jgi:hypothetical protein